MCKRHIEVNSTNVSSLVLSSPQVPLTGRKASKAVRDVDPNEAPRRVALVNAKYVTYGRVTRDLAVVLFTSSSSLIRRYYLIKMVQFYVEKLGETLCQLGIDTDKFGIRYQGRKTATRSKTWRNISAITYMGHTKMTSEHF